MMEAEINVNKCIKRRRRDSSLAVLGGNEQQEQRQQPQGDQSNTTTMKRSSRFRGVSRSVIVNKYLTLSVNPDI